MPQGGRGEAGDTHPNVRSMPTSPCECPSGNIQMCTPCAPLRGLQSCLAGGMHHACEQEVKWKVKVLVALSCLTLYSPTDCVACRALLSMGFPRQEYCSGLPCSPLGDLPEPGIKPRSPTSPANLYHLSHQESPSTIRPVTNHRGPAWLDTDRIQRFLPAGIHRRV